MLTYFHDFRDDERNQFLSSIEKSLFFFPTQNVLIFVSWVKKFYSIHLKNFSF